MNVTHCASYGVDTSQIVTERLPYRLWQVPLKKRTGTMKEQNDGGETDSTCKDGK